MHFDCYQATIEDQMESVLDTLGAEAGDAPDRVEPGKGGYNHPLSTRVLDADDRTIFQIYHGSPKADVHVYTSGNHAHAIADGIRRNWVDHRVSRVDVAQDFIEEGAFDRMHPVLRSIGKQHRLNGRLILPDDLSQGRTYYLGSPKSERMTRLYDKTAEMKKSQPRAVHADIPEDWHRLEYQWRPAKRSTKEFAAILTAEQCWLTSNWTAAVANRLLFVKGELLREPPWKPDSSRALGFMVQQYARPLEALIERVGIAQVGPELERMIEFNKQHNRH